MEVIMTLKNQEKKKIQINQLDVTKRKRTMGMTTRTSASPEKGKENKKLASCP